MKYFNLILDVNIDDQSLHTCGVQLASRHGSHTAVPTAVAADWHWRRGFGSPDASTDGHRARLTFEVVLDRVDPDCCLYPDDE